MPDLELAWYAGFLKNMHGIIFLSILAGLIIDVIIKIEIFKDEETKDKNAPKQLYKDFSEPKTLIKILNFIKGVIKTTTSCFYMMAIVFITDRGIA